MVCFRGNTLWPRKSHNLKKIIICWKPIQSVSVLLHGRHYCFDSCSSIPSTWRKEYQLDHGRNFSLIVERTQTWLRKEFHLDHGIISFNFAHRKNLRHSWKVCYTVIKWCQSSLTPLTGRCDFCIFRYSRFILGLIYSRTADFKGLSTETRHAGVGIILCAAANFSKCVTLGCKTMPVFKGM